MEWGTAKLKKISICLVIAQINLLALALAYADTPELQWQPISAELQQSHPLPHGLPTINSSKKPFPFLARQAIRLGPWIAMFLLSERYYAAVQSCPHQASAEPPSGASDLLVGYSDWGVTFTLPTKIAYFCESVSEWIARQLRWSNLVHSWPAFSAVKASPSTPSQTSGWGMVAAALAWPTITLSVGWGITVLAAQLFGRPYNPPVIGKVEAGTWAALAGFQAGDWIAYVNEQKITEFSQIARQLKPGATIQVVRGDAMTTLVLPETLGSLGILPATVAYHKLNFLQGLREGTQQWWALVQNGLFRAKNQHFAQAMESPFLHQSGKIPMGMLAIAYELVRWAAGDFIPYREVMFVSSKLEGTYLKPHLETRQFSRLSTEMKKNILNLHLGFLPLPFPMRTSGYRAIHSAFGKKVAEIIHPFGLGIDFVRRLWGNQLGGYLGFKDPMDQLDFVRAYTGTAI